MPHRTKIGLVSAALAVHNSLLDLQVGYLRLNCELVGKVVALRLPSSAARSFEIG
jgi:hypothetical protein